MIFSAASDFFLSPLERSDRTSSLIPAFESLFPSSSICFLVCATASLVKLAPPACIAFGMRFSVASALMSSYADTAAVALAPMFTWRMSTPDLLAAMVTSA